MCTNLGDAWNQRELKWALGAANIQSQKFSDAFDMGVCIV